jgi:alanyl-tRNA synthetase
MANKIKSRKQLIDKYIDFFKSKGHKEIPNASLLPENDPTVLFTTAGMHPLVPYLLGQKHPQGKRLVNVQKCIRTADIDEVGDDFHLTFFEMLGNWSLGDYFKKEAIEMSYEFLTSKKWLGISKGNLSITCFKGDKKNKIPKDRESAEHWKNLGISDSRIKFLGKEDNWWGPAGKTGPCGPDTEMFVNDCEIWNDVFMQYNKQENGEYKELSQKNVDTGMGVERTLAVLQGKSSVYETEVFQPIIKKIEKLSGKKYNKNKGQTRSIRIIADHIKAACFILAEGISPSNTEQGYVLRRLIRRAVRYGKELGMENFISKIAEPVFNIYPDYDYLKKNKKKIIEELKKEEEKFEKTLQKGLKIAEKIFKNKVPIKREKYLKLMQHPNHIEILKNLWKKKRQGKDYSIKQANISKKEIDNATISGKQGFLLYQSHGFPMEMILELARERNLFFHRGEFKRELEKHQQLSRTATKGKFKSGLADKGEQTKKFHTATHLLLAALRKVLSKKIKEEIHQKGSNITPERLRFDFNFPRKLTQEEKQKIENLINEKIKQNLPVRCEEMSVEQAKKLGAEGIFQDKYKNLEKVKVYFIGKKGQEFSKEICAGPHVENIGELAEGGKKFKIKKEESSSAGIRRIKAVLE